MTQSVEINWVPISGSRELGYLHVEGSLSFDRGPRALASFDGLPRA